MIGQCADQGKSLIVCINYNYPGPSLAEQIDDWAALGAHVLTAILCVAALAFLARLWATAKPKDGA